MNKLVAVLYGIIVIVLLNIVIDYFIKSRSSFTKERYVQDKSIKSQFMSPFENRIEILQGKHLKQLRETMNHTDKKKEENEEKEETQKEKIKESLELDPSTLVPSKDESNIEPMGDKNIMYPYFGDLPSYMQNINPVKVDYPLFDELTKNTWHGLSPYNFNEIFPTSASFSESFYK